MPKPVSGTTAVAVHPLVLLSVVDHYNRACKGTKHRAVGILLGHWKTPTLLDISNSFAVPFEEDEKNPSIWFLDHDYLENMFAMFRKVNAKERIVGWYHSGPKLRTNDILINDVLQRFVEDPVLVIIDVNPQELGLPTRAYVAVEEIHDDGTPACKTFEHLTTEIDAEEAEEVGVEHLLRDIKDIGEAGTLSHRVTKRLNSLKGLSSHLSDIHQYLALVAEKKLPVNHSISYLLQDMFNLLPDLDSEEFVTSMSIKTSDQLLVVYLAALMRSVIALHNLINNKLDNQAEEQNAMKKEQMMEKTRIAEEAAKNQTVEIEMVGVTVDDLEDKKDDAGPLGDAVTTTSENDKTVITITGLANLKRFISRLYRKSSGETVTINATGAIPKVSLSNGEVSMVLIDSNGETKLKFNERTKEENLEKIEALLNKKNKA